MSLSNDASPNDRALDLVLLIDLVLSLAGPVVSLLYWGRRDPINEAWLGFLGGNLIVWSGVALIGVVLVLRDLGAWVGGLRSVRDRDTERPVPAPPTPHVTVEPFEVPTLTIPEPDGTAVPADAPLEPDLVGAETE